MPDVAALKLLLARAASRDHIQARVGDEVNISLPQLPMTAATEFVAIEHRFQDEVGSLSLLPRRSGIGEGSMVLQRLTGRAIKPGRSHVFVYLVDVRSRKPIDEVSPVDIVIDVED